MRSTQDTEGNMTKRWPKLRFLSSSDGSVFEATPISICIRGGVVFSMLG